MDNDQCQTKKILNEINIMKMFNKNDDFVSIIAWKEDFIEEKVCMLMDYGGQSIASFMFIHGPFTNKKDILSKL